MATPPLGPQQEPSYASLLNAGLWQRGNTLSPNSRAITCWVGFSKSLSTRALIAMMKWVALVRSAVPTMANISLGSRAPLFLLSLELFATVFSYCFVSDCLCLKLSPRHILGRPPWRNGHHLQCSQIKRPENAFRFCPFCDNLWICLLSDLSDFCFQKEKGEVSELACSPLFTPRVSSFQVWANDSLLDGESWHWNVSKWCGNPGRPYPVS